MINSSATISGTAGSSSLFDIPLTLCTLTEGINLVENMITNKDPGLVVLANVHTLNLAYEQSDYKHVLKNASIVLRDGLGIEWAMKKRGVPALHNFVGTDFIPDFSSQVELPICR